MVGRRGHRPAARITAEGLVRAAAEGVALALVVFSPWAFGGNEPLFEAAILAGVAALLLLWAAHLVVRGAVGWRHCPVALALAGLVTLTAVQLAPLPTAVLGVISPNTVRLNQELLPARPEVFAGEAQPLAAAPADAQPVSLYPRATRGFLLQLLALFAVYVVARNLLAGPAALRRLAWAGVTNGAALAVFALVQAFSSPRNVVYWTYTAGSGVFGPFICRNHFPLYIDLCIGLGVGLLKGGEEEGLRRGPPPARGWYAFADRLAEIILSPRELWVVFALGLMVTASAYSLSRGGILAQLAASGVAVMAWLRNRGSRRSSALGGVAAVAVLFAAWFGMAPLQQRLSTVTDQSELERGRVTIWRSLWAEVPRFPLLGTGGRTCDFVEPMHRTSRDHSAAFTIGYAHNEYLEALVEGGVVRLGLTLLLVGAVLWRGWRFLGQPWGPRHGPVLGLLWAMTAVAVHSVLDFGIHMPAIALLAALAAAHLLTLTEGPPKSAAVPAPPAAAGRVSAYAVAGLLVPLAGLLVFEGWKLDRVERLRLAARVAGRAHQRERQLAYLDAAVRLDPDNALLHQSLGQAHLDTFAEAGQTAAAARLAAAAVGVGVADPTGPAGFAADAARLAAPDPPAAGELRRRHLRPGLHHLMTARNLCPLMAHPHARLAERRADFDSPDPAVVYWGRAVRLLPFEPSLWYAHGLQHLEDGNPDAAWPVWRHYLEMTDAKLPAVLDRAAPLLGPAGLNDRLLPDRPDVLVAAADRLFPQADDPRRRPFLERALAVLDRTSPATAPLLRRKAVIQQALNRREEAVESFRAALALDPSQTAWRLEFALLLREQGRLEEAREELLALDRRSPGRPDVRDWLAVVDREIKLKN